jgi:large subunit ribosomal protein L12e
MTQNAKKVGEDIVKEGGKWKGIRVMVQLKCVNRTAEITVNPSSSALLIKELGGYERDRKKVKNVTHKGNLTLEQIKKVAKVIEEKSMAKSFQGTVKQVLGTCLSLGCTVDKQSPKQVIAKITNGEIKV